MKTLAWLLQVAGMIVLPVGLVIGLRGDVRSEVRLLAVGGVLFLAGWVLSRRGR